MNTKCQIPCMCIFFYSASKASSYSDSEENVGMNLHLLTKMSQNIFYWCIDM